MTTTTSKLHLGKVQGIPVVSRKPEERSTTLSPCPAVVTAPRNTAVIPVVLDSGRYDLKKKSVGYVCSPAFAQIFSYALHITLSRKESRAIVAAKKSNLRCHACATEAGVFIQNTS